MVEHATENRSVGGSIPSLGTILHCIQDRGFVSNAKVGLCERLRDLILLMHAPPSGVALEIGPRIALSLMGKVP